MIGDRSGRAIGIGVMLVVSVVAGGALLGSVGASSTQDASASFVTIDDTVRVHSADGVEIRGETSLEPGSEVTVRARSSASGNAFVKLPTTTVQDDGTFAAEMNFGAYDTGVEFTVKLLHNGTALTESDGKIVSEDTQLYPTETTVADETTTSEDDDGSSGAFSPGFGPLAAVLAVGGAALLAGRRA